MVDQQPGGDRAGRRADRVRRPHQTTDTAERVRRAGGLDRRHEPDRHRRTRQAGHREQHDVHPQRGGDGGRVPEQQRHEPHADESAAVEDRRVDAMSDASDDRRSGERTDRHGPADEAEPAAVVVELLHDERDEQHHEPTLRDLRERVQPEHLGEWRVGPHGAPTARRSRSCPSACGTGDVSARTNGTAAATSTNVVASNSTMGSSPRQATNNPPSGAPSSRARLDAAPRAAFAACQFVALDQAREQRHVRRVVHLREGSLRCHHDVRRPDPIGCHGDERQDRHGLGEVGHDQASPEIDAIDDRPADGAEQRPDHQLAHEQQTRSSPPTRSRRTRTPAARRTAPSHRCR